MRPDPDYVKYSEPQDAHPSAVSADGNTILHRFRVDAVIYAKDRASAQRRLENAHVYLDAARIRDGS